MLLSLWHSAVRSPLHRLPIHVHQDISYHYQKKCQHEGQFYKIGTPADINLSIKHYNSSILYYRSKKFFGVLASEDLLLIALIFLLLEKDGEDNKLMVNALLYVLVSDYIDLSLFGF